MSSSDSCVVVVFWRLGSVAPALDCWVDTSTSASVVCRDSATAGVAAMLW